MREPPSLPEAVTELEEDERRRGFVWRSGLESRALRSAGSDAGDTMGGRFAYTLRDEQRVRNVARVPQAIVKVIPGGGVGSRGELIAQLNYLSRDGDLELEQGDGTDTWQMDCAEDIRDLATDWAMAWEDAASRDGRTARAKSKSFHMLVSFPEGTDADMARMAADAFAERLCQSGDYGDQWRNVRAWHTDRAHPHMHLVIDRLGASGRMMQIHPAKPINPKVLRALQVETAAEYGIELNDTPRVSRGHRDLDLSTAEWRADERGDMQGRSPKRAVYAKTATEFADDAIAREAVELRKLSERYQESDAPEQRREAKALEKAAFTLMGGGALDDGPRMIIERKAKRTPEIATQELPDVNTTPAPQEIERAERQRQEQELAPTQTRKFSYRDMIKQMRESRNASDATEKRPLIRLTSQTEGREDQVEQEQRSAPEPPSDVVHHEPVPERPAWEQEQLDIIRREREEFEQSAHNNSRDAPERDHDRNLCEKERDQEPRKRLTEQELRDLLVKRERELMEEQKKRQRDGPERKPDRGIGYGLD